MATSKARTEMIRTDSAAAGASPLGEPDKPPRLAADEEPIPSEVLSVIESKIDELVDPARQLRANEDAPSRRCSISKIASRPSCRPIPTTTTTARHDQCTEENDDDHSGEMGRYFRRNSTDRAPAQRADEDATDYLRRLSRIGHRYIPAHEEIARVKFDDTLPDAVVPKFSEMMRAAVERNLYRTDNMQSGELRAVLVVDPNTGAQQRHFIGPDSFVTDPAYGHQPCRRVTRISAPAGSTLWQDAAMTRRAASAAW